MKKKKDKISILILEDDPFYIEVIKKALKQEKYSITFLGDSKEIGKSLESTHIDIIISNLQLLKKNDEKIIEVLKEKYKETEIIILTKYENINNAINGIKKGAEECLTKPFNEEILISSINRCIEKINNKKLLKIESVVDFHGIIGQSKKMQEVYNIITKASAKNANVLIYGESGTGKELVARAIHYNSTRAKTPFIPVNCGGIPESLLESELFGYLKGSFTGANETRLGFFQTANGGTIFLDEISETSPSMQVKLLRVLQNKEVLMIGSREPKAIDVRIIAATNKNISKLIEKGLFREDLYYRLNVIPIDIPSLKERGEDITLLIHYFLKKYSYEYENPKIKISHDAILDLKKYHWPGNVRELENIIQRLVIMCDDNLITPSHLPSLIRPHILEMPKNMDVLLSLEEVEVEYIKKVLAFTNNNKSYASRILKIDRKTLWGKFKKYKLR